MDGLISLSQGSGGRQSNDLIRKIFATKFGMPEPLTDSAILKSEGSTLSFTTDSFVVDPLFFPGGDIGKLAVCGTVNDLAVSGAEPLFLSASFIIEEGFPMNDLESVAVSMAREAEVAGVRIVTGDTKVVEKGKCDKLFINTSGIGTIKKSREHISTGLNIKPGDKLIINGPVGNHAIAILGARKNLNFSTPVISDCASLNRMVKAMLEQCRGIRFMRDITRGGLAAVLNELALITKTGISVDELSIPVDEPVRGSCEMLGFDPLSLANEGKILVVAAPGEEQKVLDIMNNDPLGKDAGLIGEIVEEKPGRVVLNTSVGGKRIIDMPSGVLLPRIC